MSASRDLATVLEQMIAAVPPTAQALAEELEVVRESAAFAAPEIMGIHWRRVPPVLEKALSGFTASELGDPAHWAGRVCAIWMGKSDGRTP